MVLGLIKVDAKGVYSTHKLNCHIFNMVYITCCYLYRIVYCDIPPNLFLVTCLLT